MVLKMFITGGTGFIGRNLKEELAGKYEISASSSKELDLLDTEKVSDYLKEHKFDIVIHSADRGESFLDRDKLKKEMIVKTRRRINEKFNR